MNDVTNIAAKRNAQWLEGAEHGRKAERDRILAILRHEKVWPAKVVHLVEADPRRDAVVKAAARWAAAHESGVSLAEDMTQCELRAAVEKRQRGGR